MMTNCFCGMVDQRKAFCFISSQDHCQRSSPLRISDTSQAWFECPENLSSGLVEWSCAVVISTIPGRHWELDSLNEYKLDKNTQLIFEIYGDTNLFNLVHYTCFIRLEEATCAKLKKINEWNSNSLDFNIDKGYYEKTRKPPNKVLLITDVEQSGSTLHCIWGKKFDILVEETQSWSIYLTTSVATERNRFSEPNL